LVKTAARGGRHRTKTWYGEHITAVRCAAVVLCLATLVVVVRHTKTPEPAASGGPPPVQAVRYLGVFEPDAPRSYAKIERFAQTVGRHPNLVMYYSGWFEPFHKAFAEKAAQHGATTIVEINPHRISLARIASGAYDSYLTSFADSVAAFGHNVVISFGHEMNGFWYPWGYKHVPPATFVAAWRHIVTVFRQRGATNVTWLWQVNSASPKTGPVRDWWPGSRYVTWVGVSGYYFMPHETFDYIFKPVVADIRRFTRDPILIAETAVGHFPNQASKINELFTGIRSQHYLGLVWFDRNKASDGIYKGGNWRLEGNPVGISAFRTALGTTR